jgi:hypothetical protein
MISLYNAYTNRKLEFNSVQELQADLASDGHQQ